MTDLSDAESRLETLETHAAHQAMMIEELNGAVAAQWGTIDALRRQMRDLAERLDAAETRAGPPVAQRPPHY